MKTEIDFAEGLWADGERRVWPGCRPLVRSSCRIMYERRKYRCVLLFMLLSFGGGLVYLGYFCADSVCAWSAAAPVVSSDNAHLESYVEGRVQRQRFGDDTLLRRYDDFDVEGTQDVLVFLHIQKTGGTTFGKHLVKNIELSTPCTCYRDRKRCDCENSQQHIWLFSRYSTGWRCGLHADWTELKNCVSDVLDEQEGSEVQRRYLYITILRDPYLRYLSEWRHVQRGSTWLDARLKCGGRQATLDEVPFCFSGPDWSGVSLDEFLACPHNLASNRQTRMLANLSLVSCYNRSSMAAAERDRVMLESAKQNLRDLAFFGLTEYQRQSQLLFEHAFHLEFIDDFMQHNRTHANRVDVSAEQRQTILLNNHLDVELYQFAKDLFFQRFEALNVQLTDMVGEGSSESAEEGDENYEEEEQEAT